MQKGIRLYMTNKKKVLIFPAGTEIASEILNALKLSKFVEIYGGASADDHAEFVYDNLIKGFPFVKEDGFIEYLNKVIDKYKIEYVYPAHDDALTYMAKHVDKIHATVISADYETVSICRSKSTTYKYFEEFSFVPKLYDSVDDVESYPVFVKPDKGQGAVGAKRINTSNELRESIKQNKNLIICENLSGQEYTVDCYTDFKGKLRVAKLRNRERIKAGISVRSSSLPLNDEVKDIAEAINSKLKFKGAWFFQLKKDDKDKYRLLEISARIPGTMGLSRNMGINFPLLTLFEFWGYDIDIVDNQYDITLDRAFYSAYRIDYDYKYMYVDYDDTLVVDGRINLMLLSLLYQAKRKGIKIILLSKHIGDIYEDMQKIHICSTLFDEVCVIGVEEEKSSFITHKDAIFIDDSYAERVKVWKNSKIPVFDVDMVESLIEWK